MSDAMTETEQSADPKWMRILKEECSKATIADVARQLDYSRSSVSMVMSGNYLGGTAKIAAKVITTFTDSIQCPHLGCDISKGACIDHQSRPMPTSDPSALRHWTACRGGCPVSYHSIEDEKSHA